MIDALNALRPGKAQMLRPNAMRLSSPPRFSGTAPFDSKPDSFQRRNLENKTLSVKFQGAAKPAGAVNPFQANADSFKVAPGKASKLNDVSSAIHARLNIAKETIASNLTRQNQLGAVVKESPVRPANPFMTPENMLFNRHAAHMMQVTKSPAITQQAVAALSKPKMDAFHNLPLKLASGVTAAVAPLAAFTILPLQPLAPILAKLFSVVKIPTLIP